MENAVSIIVQLGSADDKNSLARCLLETARIAPMGFGIHINLKVPLPWVSMEWMIGCCHVTKINHSVSYSEEVAQYLLNAVHTLSSTAQPQVEVISQSDPLVALLEKCFNKETVPGFD